MTEITNGAELSRLLLRRGTTAAEVASMELEVLTQMVGYRRKRKVAPDAIDSALTDEQIAKAIWDYERTDPIDWPVTPRERMLDTRGSVRWGAVGAVLGLLLPLSMLILRLYVCGIAQTVHPLVESDRPAYNLRVVGGLVFGCGALGAILGRALGLFGGSHQLLNQLHSCLHALFS